MLAVLVLASLVLITMDYRHGGEGALGELQRGVTALFAPVQDGLAAAVRPLERFMSSLTELTRLREENAALEADLQALREQQVSTADLLRENEELRALVGMSERLEFTTSAGRVIAQPPGALRWSVLIDIGSDHGVAENMPVINASGLVGKVTLVTRRYARVQLAASPNAGYAVRVAESGAQGLLSGRGSRPLQLQVVDEPDVELPDGGEVVTRAFPGTSIPDGIPIGILDAPDGDPAAGRFVDVHPYVDYANLDIVLVVLDAPVVPSVDDLEPGSDAQAEPGGDDRPGADDGQPPTTTPTGERG